MNPPVRSGKTPQASIQKSQKEKKDIHPQRKGHRPAGLAQKFPTKGPLKRSYLQGRQRKFQNTNRKPIRRLFPEQPRLGAPETHQHQQKNHRHLI
jgi:hypothetical protein